MNKTNPIRAAFTIALAGVACVAILPGCRDDRSTKPPRQFFPDMDDQPKWRNQSKSEFFADGRTMRPLVEGTVPFGRVTWVRDDAQAADAWATKWMQSRRDLLREDEATFTGMNADGSYIEKIPVPVNRAMLEHGRQKFEINCSVCHGYQGDGKGTVGVQWGAPVPSYHDVKYKDRKLETARDGYLFFVAMNGVRTMPAYGHTLTERDAWSVVAYIRALQATHEGTINDVPQSARPEVEKALEAAAQPAGGQK